jgi:hypothetical protein
MAGAARSTTNGHAAAPTADTVQTTLPNGGTAAPADHTADGRFAPGNKAAAGRANAFTRKLGGLRAVFIDAAASPEQVAEVAVKLLELSKQGDVAAAGLYLSYTLGRPSKVIDPDRIDLGEWELLRAWPSPAALAAVLDTVYPAAAAEKVRERGLREGVQLGEVLEKFMAHLGGAPPEFFHRQYQAEKEARRRRAARA